MLDVDGYRQKCRILLDTGSQSNLITEDLCNRLKLPRFKINMQITGINLSATNLKQRTEVEMHSRVNSKLFKLSCLITEKIIENLPLSFVNKDQLKIPKNITLADPKFNEPGKIDMLIGSGLFWNLIKNNTFKVKGSGLHCQNTELGWVVAGNVYQTIPQYKSVCNIGINQQIHNQIENFWKLESASSEIKRLSPEELACERHFDSTVKLVNGRYTVSLPLNQDPLILGESKTIAQKRLLSLERSLKKDQNLRNAYDSFMLDYLSQDHMSIIEEKLLREKQTPVYYVPHHIVKSPNSITTKIRVVFDGSAKTEKGISVNEIQMTGPSLQEDLFTILVRFRLYTYVMSADIKQMYKQINLNNDHRNLQCILWKPDPNGPIKTCRLNTVTYGYKSSAYLAIKCLANSGDIIKNEEPEVSRIIKEDFYVDNLLTGSNSIKELKTYKIKIEKHLNECGFPLRQWASNNPFVLEGTTENMTSMIITDDKGIKTLGMLWNPVQDELQFVIKNEDKIKHTKRSLLSSISKIFDPLGLVNPITVRAKLMMQKLWTLNDDWDDLIPIELENEWKIHTTQFEELKSFQVQRHVLDPEAKNVDMHVFCDASEEAYGSCVYLVSQNSE